MVMFIKKFPTSPIEWCSNGFPANISTSVQRCFNVVNQGWNNVDPMLKKKQNPTSDFRTQWGNWRGTLKLKVLKFQNLKTSLKNPQTLLRSLEFVINQNLKYNAITVLNLARSWSTSTQISYFRCKLTNWATPNLPNLSSLMA